MKSTWQLVGFAFFVFSFTYGMQDRSFMISLEGQMMDTELVSAHNFSEDSTQFLKRLQQAVRILNLMEKAGSLVIPLDVECQERSLRWCNTTFYSMQMVMCIDHLCMQKKLEPLFCVWSSLVFSKQHKESLLIHEFTKVVLVLIYASLQEHFTLAHEELLVRASLDMKNLDALTLEELLVILDLLVDEIPDFLEKVELTNHQLSWGDWAKKYWLIAPVSAVIAGIKIYLSYLATQTEHQ